MKEEEKSEFEKAVERGTGKSIDWIRRTPLSEQFKPLSEKQRVCYKKQLKRRVW